MATRQQIIDHARTEVAELSVALVNVKPEEFDFGQRFTSDGDPVWNFIEAVQCDYCDQYIVGDEHHGFVDDDGNAVPVPEDVDLRKVDRWRWDADDWADRNGYESCPQQGSGFMEFDTAEGPMMNYRYPLGNDRDHFTQDDAYLIAGLPLCLVEHAGVDYLALTGGGMDLSWEICEAYVRLGYLPPIHFRLPEMAGLHLTPETALVVAAVARANEVVGGWARHGREAAGRLLTTLPL